MGETSWVFLLVGSFAAVGAAMTVGTLAALLRYYRTGILPGAEDAAEIDRARVLRLWVRVVAGAGLTAIGIVALERAGIL